ncbi:MAG: CDP-diacylglycerol--serine O-phosphatidyltransferase [Planctomycetes bacterium]|nr:CDP-diacylglycerol--serine O-phosphatidyltransferase [Planctomycetota bacterium]
MMKRIRTIAVLPTMFTLGNVVCGFFAIVLAARVDKPESLMDVAPGDAGSLILSAWLIFLAMLFDALDGYVARLTKTASDFGAQLDSLCDLVTFGVAPAFLLVKMCPRFEFLHREAAWVIAACFVACAAMRLARFNVETSEEDDHMFFNGLPTPAAAASIAGFAIMFFALRKESSQFVYAPQVDAVLQTVLPFFAALVALLMVSRIPYPHIVNQFFGGQRSFAHVVGLLFALAMVMVVRNHAVPIICCAFVFSGPLRLAWRKVVEHRRQEEPLF